MGQPVQDRPEHPDRGLDVAASHRLEERRVKRFAHRDGHGEQDGHGERDSLEYTRPIASGRHTGEDTVETPNTAAAARSLNFCAFYHASEGRLKTVILRSEATKQPSRVSVVA
jgi:hypothetical protein